MTIISAKKILFDLTNGKYNITSKTPHTELIEEYLSSHKSEEDKKYYAEEDDKKDKTGKINQADGEDDEKEVTKSEEEKKSEKEEVLLFQKEKDNVSIVSSSSQMVYEVEDGDTAKSITNKCIKREIDSADDKDINYEDVQEVFRKENGIRSNSDLEEGQEVKLTAAKKEIKRQKNQQANNPAASNPINQNYNINTQEQEGNNDSFKYANGNQNDIEVQATQYETLIREGYFNIPNNYNAVLNNPRYTEKLITLSRSEAI